jgi:type VI protein secretion system component VasF
MDDLGRKLRRTRIRASSELSPHGRRIDSEILRRKGAFLLPLWVAGAVCCAAVIAGWAALYASNASVVNDLTSSIHSLIAK